MEIQCQHPDIVSKAGELGTPLRIYQFVRNQIEYEVYYGSKKGALGTLWSGSGNDYDQASLLIALLRATGIDARYAIGMVAVDWEQLSQWSKTRYLAPGATTLGSGALEVFYAQYCGPTGKGSPCHPDTNPKRFQLPGGFSGALLEHAWVEAQIPAHYRGHAVGVTDLRWIPLDASWKQKAYPESVVDIAVGNEVTGDCGTAQAPKVCFDYEGLYSRFDPRLASEIWERQIQQHLAAAHPGKTLADVIYDGPIIPDAGEVLPMSLPFSPRPEVVGGPQPTPGVVNVSDIGLMTDNVKRRFEIELRLQFLWLYHDPVNGWRWLPPPYWPEPLTIKTFAVPELIGKRVTVDWEPANEASLIKTLQHGGYMGGVPAGQPFRNLMELCLNAHATGQFHPDCPNVMPSLRVDSVEHNGVLETMLAAFPQIAQLLGESTRWQLEIHRDAVPGERAQPPPLYPLTSGIDFAVALDANHVGAAQIEERVDALLALQQSFPLLDEGEGDGNGNGVFGEVLLDQNANGVIDAGCNYADPQSAMAQCDIALAAQFNVKHQIIGELLHVATLRYMQRVREEFERVLAIDGFVGMFSPIVGMTRSGAHFTYLFDQPVGVEPASPVIDVRGFSFRTAGIDGGAAPRREGRLLAHVASALEHQVWEELIGREFVSTVKGIQLVRERFPKRPIHEFTAPPDTASTVGAEMDFRFDRVSEGTRSALSTLLTNPATILETYVATPAAAVFSAGAQPFEVYYAERVEASGVDYEMAIRIGSETLGGAGENPWTDFWVSDLFAGPDWFDESMQINLNRGWGEVIFDPVPSPESFDTTGDRSSMDSALSRVLVGDPVSMISGNLYHQETDVSIRSDGPPFHLARTYNSRIEEAGALGFGWAHSYELSVRPVRDPQEFVYLPTAIYGFGNQTNVEAARSDTLSKPPSLAGGAVERIEWKALPAVVLEQIDSIEGVTLELAFGREESTFSITSPTTGQGPITVNGASRVDFESIELEFGTGPPSLAAPIHVDLNGFDFDELYYARLRIRYRGPAVDRYELERQSLAGWSMPEALEDDDPSTCTAPDQDNGPGAIDFGPQSPLNVFGYELLASVMRQNGYWAQARLWRGEPDQENPPLDLGEPIAVGPDWDYGAQLRFNTIADATGLNPYGFKIRFQSDFLQFLTPPNEVSLCHLQYRILGIPRQRDLVLEDGSRVRFTERSVGQSPEWVAASGDHEELSEEKAQSGATVGFSVRRPDGRLLEFDHAAPDGSFKLTRITDPQGRSLILSYDLTTHQLESVSRDGSMLLPGGTNIAPGLTFTWAGPYLDRVTDWTGRTWDYEVDVNGHLREVKNPDQVHRVVSGTKYEYGLYTQLEPPNLRHNLTKVLYPKDVQNAPDHWVEFSYYLSDRVSSHIDSLLNRQTYLFNVSRLESQTTDARGFTTVYRHDRASNLVQRVDPDGAMWNWEYDENRNVTKEIDPFGRAREFNHYDDHQGDACAKPGEIKDPDGRSRLITYDPVTCAERTVTDKRGNVHSATWLNGLPTSASATLLTVPGPGTIALGHREYDDPSNPRVLDRIVEAIALGESREAVTDFSYPRNDRDAERIEYWEDGDGDGNLDESQDPDQLLSAVELEYDDLGRVKARRIDRIDDPDGATPPVAIVTEFEYDRLDRATRITRPDGTVVVSGYDDNGNLASEYLQEPRPDATADLHQSRVLTYDSLDRLETVTDAAGGVTRFQYDAVGNRIATIDPLGNVTRVEYDAVNRPIRTIDPTGAVYQIEYDLLGRVVAEIDPTGVRSARSYDEVGNLTSLQLGDLEPAERRIFYGPAPGEYREEVEDPNNRVTEFRFDALGRVFEIEDAALGLTLMQHDVRGNLTQLTDPIGGLSGFGYDALSRVISEAFPYTPLARITKYDETGNPVRITKPDACRIDMHYDRMGRLLRQHSTSCPGGAVAAVDDRFAYDARGNVVAAQNSHVELLREYDDLDRLVREIDLRFQTSVAYRYDASSRLEGKVYPDGSVLSVSYDPAGRPIGITDPFGDTTRYVYDAAGRRIETQSAASSLSTVLAYEAGTGRLRAATSSRAIGNPNLVVSTRNYTQYDAAGNRERINNGPGTGTTILTYDELHRLASVDPPTGEPTHYSYDAAGNRDKVGRQSGGTFTAPYTRYEYYAQTTHRLANVKDDQNNFRERFGLYDPNGNPSSWTPPGASSARVFTWDALDRLVAISVGYSASYVYDPFGRRIEKSEAGSTTVYQYDGLDVVAEYNDDHVLQATYIFGPGIDEPIKILRGTTLASYHADGLGSILAVAPIQDSGAALATYTYGPFGEDQATQVQQGFANAYTYTGRERDGSGLYYYRARYYLAEVGRFLTPDPIGLRGGINPYAYVGSNPINFTDPFGLTSISKNSFSNLASPLESTMSPAPGSEFTGFASNVASSFALHAVSGTQQLLNVSAQGILLPFDFAEAVNREIGPTLDMLTFNATAACPVCTVATFSLRTALSGVGAIGRFGRTGASSFGRFFYDSRSFAQIGREYWATNGPAAGRSLHHWLIPQRTTWLPEGFRNAGFNLLELPALRGTLHPSLGLNQWMGFARNWGPSSARQAALVENAIRLGVPAAAAGAGYAGYQIGSEVAGP